MLLKEFYSKKIKLFSAIIICVALASCSAKKSFDRENDIIDTQNNMTREQVEESLFGKHKDSSENSSKGDSSRFEPSIPDVSNILAAPPSLADSLPDKLISLSITEDVPLKDVLIELSRLADVDMEIDPTIDGGIILRVTDRPFKSVINRVAKLGGLRYSVEDRIVRIERDTPYKVDYKVDFLNIKRDTSSTTSVDTQSLSSSATGDSDSSGASGSNSTITAESEGDVWPSVKLALVNILKFTEKSHMTANNISEDDSEINTDDILQLNQQAGVISVIGTQRQHEQIASYLKETQRTSSAQVLIEAKVVEVILDKEYRSGIDWGSLNSHSLGLEVKGKFDGGVSSTADFFTLSASSGKKGLSTAISFTEKFGVTKTLSSPRVNAIHNQQAVLSFTTQQVFFELEVVEESVDDGAGGTSTTANVTSEIKTVPVGVILNLQPSINLDTQEVTMHVRPTLSTISSFESDPATDIILARQTNVNEITIENNIPIIETRELDTILKIKSGNIMVIGGLMKNETGSTDVGVPYAGRVPFLGNLFKSKVQTNVVTETIIFIKATIVPTHGNNIPGSDKRIYNKFIRKSDPHPLAF